MDYGEERYRALGMANGRLMAVCYCLRDDRFRIITARLQGHGLPATLVKPLAP